MEFLDKKIDEFVVKNTQPEPEILYQLSRETHLKLINPRMLAGHFQGRVISMLSNMIKPNKVLEIGTFTGYSAICWAEGLTEEGIIHTIDINEELEPFTSKYFKKTGIDNKIKTYFGNAIDIIPTIKEQFDIVFIDADKSNYINYYNLVFDKVKKGGYIIADNVLWSGKVIEKYSDLDLDTKTLVDYCKMTTNDARVENVLFPIRDGLMISRKLI